MSPKLSQVRAQRIISHKLPIPAVPTFQAQRGHLIFLKIRFFQGNAQRKMVLNPRGKEGDGLEIKAPGEEEWCCRNCWNGALFGRKEKSRYRYPGQLCCLASCPSCCVCAQGWMSFSPSALGNPGSSSSPCSALLTANKQSEGFVIWKGFVIFISPGNVMGTPNLSYKYKYKSCAFAAI